jgi:hypothetical protein
MPGSRRHLLAILALAASAVAVWAYVRYSAGREEFQQWFRTRPISTPIDLSRPGMVTVPFRSGPVGHGQRLYLEVGPEKRHAETDILDGLDAVLHFRGEDGREVYSTPLAGGDDNGTWFCAISSADVPHGDYTLTIEVKEGAPKLAGVEQTLSSRLWICELEAVPVMLRALWAIMTGAAAGLLWLWVIVRAVRAAAKRTAPA